MVAPTPNNDRNNPRLKDYLQAVFAFLFAPIDAVFGLFKGLYYFITAPRGEYVWGISNREVESNNQQTVGDLGGRAATASTNLRRIFAVAVVVLCVLGFVGALLAPIPGVTPLYTLTILGVLKAAGITAAWTTAARLVGGAVGAVVDFFILSKRLGTKTNEIPQENNGQENGNSLSATRRIAVGLGCRVLVGAFAGEATSKMSVAVQNNSSRQAANSVNPDMSSQKPLDPASKASCD